MLCSQRCPRAGYVSQITILLLGILFFHAEGRADIIYVYQGQTFNEIDVGDAFVLGVDRISGTFRFDSVGDTTPDVTLAVTSSGSPSIPFMISMQNVAYGGQWTDTNNDGVVDDPFALGYGFILTANMIGGAFPEEIQIDSELGDAVAVDFNLSELSFSQLATAPQNPNGFQFVPEPSSWVMLLSAVGILCNRRRRDE